MNLRSILLLTSLAGSLTACATLPSSGPTGSQVREDIVEQQAAHQIQLVEVADMASVPTVPSGEPIALPELAPPPTDMIGPGDVLGVSVYEAGVTLFGGSSAPSTEGASFDPSVKVQTLPPLRVTDDGYITVPYAGRLRVLGSTVDEVRGRIRDALQGYSQNPQVLVVLQSVINNSVIVSGEISNPGRLVLQTNRETLSDVIALAGGYRGNASDLRLRVMRSGRSAQVRFSDLVDNPAMDVRVYPGDRVMLVQDPYSYSVLGAAGRVERVPFGRASVSLAEAISASGGVNPGAGDPEAIFVFRYVTGPDGQRRPVAYHVNMMRAGSFFLAQSFAMQDKDVLYFGNAKANQPSKMIQLVSQLFSPFITVISAAQVLQSN